MPSPRVYGIEKQSAIRRSDLCIGAGSGMRTCLGRSPRQEQLPAIQEPLRQVLEPKTAQQYPGADVQFLHAKHKEMASVEQIKDIHWICEKTLTLMHELHQDHLASKSASKFNVQQEAALHSTPVRAQDIHAHKLLASTAAPQSEDFSLAFQNKFNAEIVHTLEEALKQSYTQQTETWGARMLQNIHTECASLTLTVGRSVDALLSANSAHSQAMAVHADTLQAMNNKIEKVSTTLADLMSVPNPWNPSFGSQVLNQASTLDTGHISTLANKIDNLDVAVQAALACQQEASTQNSERQPPQSKAEVVVAGSTRLMIQTRESLSKRDADNQKKAKEAEAGRCEVHDQLMEDARSEFFSGVGVGQVDDQGRRISSSEAEFRDEMCIRGAGGVTAPPKLKDDASFSAVFANDLDLGKPLYYVEDFYKETGYAQSIARTREFSVVSNLMICVNAVYIGIEADHNNANNLYDASLPYIIAENVFCAYFTLEWLVRVLAFNNLGDCFRDGWIRFDTVLVVSMVLETWVLMPIFFSSGGHVNIPTGPLRLLRLLKVTRMARMMRAFPELVTMVKGLMKSIRAITGSLLLVLLLLYCFSIMMHMLLRDEDSLNSMLHTDLQYDFSTVPHCMWCLGMAGVFMLDGAANIATYLVFSKKTNIKVAGWAFVVFSLLTAMTVLQMLIGVLCEVIVDTKKEHEASKIVAIMKQQLVNRLLEHDDGDGKITKAELAEVLNDPQCKALLRSLKINRLFLLEMQKLMFPTKDAAVPFKLLTEIILECRGDSYATVDTVAGGLNYLATELRTSESVLLGGINDRLDEIASRLGIVAVEEDESTHS